MQIYLVFDKIQKVWNYGGSGAEPLPILAPGKAFRDCEFEGSEKE